MSAPTVILIPVLDDWPALAVLLPRIRAVLDSRQSAVAVLIVDDGSREPAPPDLLAGLARPFEWVRILRVKRNLGHQRAIAVGLSYLDEHVPCEAVVVMDADGEDRPEDIPRLLDRSRQDGGASIVFAERRRRAEGLVFRVGYSLYRALHRVLTGAAVRVGNFSVIPRDRLASLVTVSELWIHYAASAFRSRQPIALVPAARAARADGQSRMKFVGLVVHGLSAISVYSDVVFTRLVVVAAAIGASAVLLVGVALFVGLFTDVAVPMWTAYALGLLLVILFQAATFVAALTFVVLGNRQQLTIVPRRDYAVFVGTVEERS
jgi:glycosyltransferase involved in cell wall biosynthesis